MDIRLGVIEEVMSFWKGRVILTAAELDIFTHLDGAPMTSKTTARKVGADVRALDRLLNALCALGFLEKDGDVFRLSPRGELLSARHPQTVRPMVMHFIGLWNNWSSLTDVVRQGRPAKHSGFDWDEEARNAFIGAMDAIGRDLSMTIADFFDGTRFKCLLDIGGASGTYTIAFLKKNPAMKAILFDLEPVTPIARERIQAEGLTDRVKIVPGNFYKDELPSNVDLALLSAIIHQNSPAQNLDLFKRIYRALDPGGSLLIRDHIMEPSRTEPAAGTFFAINMLVGTEGGDTYTFAEIKVGLEEAGFADVRLLRMGKQMDGLVQAEKL